MPAPKGHPKWGGKPKGHKSQATLSKEAIRARVQALVSAALDPMTEAQISQAQGIKYLVTREKKTGKFIRVGEAMAKAKQGDTEETIEVWEKDPSTPAFTDLMNRAADKPKEQAQEVILSGTLTIATRLQEARKRLAARQSD